jgi:heat shock protein HslJ
LDYIGTYKGVLPCADCEGLETVLCINENNTYKLQTRYLGKGDKVFEQKGTFSWDDKGIKIILNGIENASNQYFVGENSVTQLDLSGKIISGKLALQYVLSKQSSEVQTDVTEHSSATKVNLNNRMEAQTVIKKVNPAVGKATLAETKWRLMTLNGKIVNQNQSKQYFIKLNSNDGRFTAYAGCNNISGTYVMPSAFGLSFSNAAMTRMACPSMDLETRFVTILEQTDRYSLKDNILKFQKGKTKVLATFEPLN